ncbi:ATP-dependent DNA/RNA helicase dhx36 [Blyttiomyces sp. JEL0837]|nr:ATP-dependent DNA/RNA helicase dhx36 [Blyttiomyces sp. JEL0837]
MASSGNNGGGGGGGGSWRDRGTTDGNGNGSYNSPPAFASSSRPSTPRGGFANRPPSRGSVGRGQGAFNSNNGMNESASPAAGGPRTISLSSQQQQPQDQMSSSGGSGSGSGTYRPPHQRQSFQPSTPSQQQHMQSNQFQQQQPTTTNVSEEICAEDFNYIQRYFGSFKRMPSYDYTESRPQGHHKPLITCSLEVPYPSTQGATSFRVEATGATKKEARHHLAKRFKEVIEGEGLMKAALDMKAAFKHSGAVFPAPPGMAGVGMGMGMGSGGHHSGGSRRPMSMSTAEAPMEWDGPMGPGILKRPSSQQGFSGKKTALPVPLASDHVPDSWDDEAEVKASSGSGFGRGGKRDRGGGAGGRRGGGGGQGQGVGGGFDGGLDGMHYQQAAPPQQDIDWWDDSAPAAQPVAPSQSVANAGGWGFDAQPQDDYYDQGQYGGHRGAFGGHHPAGDSRFGGAGGKWTGHAASSGGHMGMVPPTRYENGGGYGHVQHQHNFYPYQQHHHMGGGAGQSYGMGGHGHHLAGSHHMHPQHYHREPPPPHPSTRLPATIEDNIKKFVNFYCQKFKLPTPVPQAFQNHNFNSAGRGRRVKQIMGDWNVKLEVPSHVTIEGKDTNGPIVGIGAGRNKKDATPRAWEDLCARLLLVSPQALVDQFTSFATPFKKRLAEMLAQPVKVDIGEAALARLETVLRDLKNADVFKVPRLPPKPVMTQGFGGNGGQFFDPQQGRNSFQPLLPIPSHIIRPEDLVPIPAELSKSQDLPMYGFYPIVMSAIENNPVTVLSAETGAGKTTQLPQFILAHGLDVRNRYNVIRPPVKIIVTQPRRIAAISVAQRVAQERGEIVGKNSAIGYQVRFEEARPKSDPRDGHVGKVSFLSFKWHHLVKCWFQDDPNLSDVTHIILDEVHERDLNTDLLLITTRQLLQRRPDIKIILMSATAETGLFAEYFRGYGFEGRHGNMPPIVSVPGRLYPVTEFYLEDIADIVEHDMRVRLSNDTFKFLRSELSTMGPPPAPVRGEEFPYDLFEALIAHISFTRGEGAVLVFLPGWQEINTLQNKMKEEDNFRAGFGDPSRFRVFPLHSSVPTAGQQEVFEVPPPGVRKVILSTNIAETSVTINDVVYVIDSGKIRINTYDSNSRISSLNSVWASASNIKQRCGRAGRCQPGQYFSLLSRRRRQGLPFSMPPELLRVDLQSTALKVKALNIAPQTAAVLAQAPEPPPAFNVHQALRDLRALGAFDEAENLTPLGKVLANLPVDPWIGKMVLEGAVFGCLDPILTVAGAMEIGRGIYAIHPDDKQRARQHILTNFAVGTESDQLAMLVAFRSWKKSGSSREYAGNNFLHGTSLLNIEKSKAQLMRVLEDGGFLQRRRVSASFGRDRDAFGDEMLMGGSEANEHSQDMAMVRAILCGALFPNIAEVMGKDEYKSNTDYKLRLTGGSVNSWRGLLSATPGADAALGVSTSIAQPSASGQQGGKSSGGYASADLLDWVPDDGPIDDAAIELSGAPLPPRLLAYQDKQRVEGLVYLRSTTRVDPLALLLFAPSGPSDFNQDAYADVKMSSLAWTRLENRPAAMLSGWIKVQVQDEQRARVIDEVRGWLAKYLDWMIWRRAVRKQEGYGSQQDKGEMSEEEEERLGKVLVREVVGVIGAACS